jgi:spore coat polysaccharide biosynthesis protein SpsF (cytidylyltransferase family)
MSKTVVVIQARIGSTRLPGKVLLDVCGKPMIQHVVERAKAIKRVQQVCLAVPHADFFTFAPLAEEWGIKAYAGPGNDVLARYAKVAELTGADVIVRVTGDCPLIAPEVCGKVLRPFLEGRYGFSTNDTELSGYPDGLDCEVFTRGILEQADQECIRADWREHVCPWMEANTVTNLILDTPKGPKWPKLSVDTQDDLDRVRRIMPRIPAGDYSWQATQKAIRAEKLL